MCDKRVPQFNDLDVMFAMKLNIIFSLNQLTNNGLDSLRKWLVWEVYNTLFHLDLTQASPTPFVTVDH